MLTFIVIVGVAGFVAYKVGSAAVRHPEAAAGVGKVVVGMLRR